MKSFSFKAVKSIWGMSFILLMLLACSSQEKEPVAMVNGKPIQRHELETELARVRGTLGAAAFHGELLDNLKMSVLEQLIEQRLVGEQAREYGVAVSDAEVDARIAELSSDYSEGGFEKALRDNSVNMSEFRGQIHDLMLMQKVIVTVLGQHIEPDEEEIRRYYRSNVGDFSEPERVHARQIVVQSREEAEALRSRLQKGANFGELARQHSLTPERERDGDIGTFAQGEMPPEFDIAFTLKPGQISPVVRSPYGFHILTLVERLPARLVPLEEVQEEARERLIRERTERAYKNWLSELRSEAQVRIFPRVMAEIQ